MKRRMKQKKYGILMFVGIVVMVLMPFAPCRAEWGYDSSEVSSGPTSGSDSEMGDFYWWSWEFDITDINRGADSTGAWAGALIDTEAYVQIYAAEDNLSKGASAGGAVWGRSYYSNNDPNDPTPLIIEWEIDGWGVVNVSGWVEGNMLGEGDTMYSYANVYAAVYGSAEGSGYGHAGGYVSRDGYGSAHVYTGGEAEEYDSDVGEGFESYSAHLAFTIDAEGDEPFYGTSYKAEAKVLALSTTGTTVSVSQGNAYAYAYSGATLRGSVDNWISW